MRTAEREIGGKIPKRRSIVMRRGDRLHMMKVGSLLVAFGLRHTKTLCFWRPVSIFF